MRKILVTGALGQIGSELVLKLRELYGESNVIASDIRSPDDLSADNLFEIIDVTVAEQIFKVAKQYQVDTIIHLAATLSATAELDPLRAWHLNMGGLMNALEVAKQLNLKLFVASSIAAFGPTTPQDNTPQNTIQRPTTMYGINKVAGELLCDYYFLRYGVDTRGIRFPGLISHLTKPGGGTTDYAVDIYYQAIKEKSYTCYLKEDTYMDMMYMPDAIEAIIQLMEADGERLIHRNAYNITSFSASPNCFATKIKEYVPDFTMHYDIDWTKQKIADSWPNSIDASKAFEEWGFRGAYDLERVTKDMLSQLAQKLIKY